MENTKKTRMSACEDRHTNRAIAALREAEAEITMALSGRLGEAIYDNEAFWATRKAIAVLLTNLENDTAILVENSKTE